MMMRSGPMIGNCVRDDGVKALPQRHKDTKIRGASKFLIEIRPGALRTFTKRGTNGFATSAPPRLRGNAYFLVRQSRHTSGEAGQSHVPVPTAQSYRKRKCLDR